MSCFFFFIDPPPPYISPLSLPAPLPFSPPCWRYAGCRPPPHRRRRRWPRRCRPSREARRSLRRARCPPPRSEEHTSELQSRQYLVCRLLLEKKKNHASVVHTPSSCLFCL